MRTKIYNAYEHMIAFVVVSGATLGCAYSLYGLTYNVV
jgi:hypothetical protein